MEEMQGIWMGMSCAKNVPEREKERGRTSRGKWGKKLQKLSFLMLEIMLKMDISRQTKGQNSQTNGAF